MKIFSFRSQFCFLALMAAGMSVQTLTASAQDPVVVVNGGFEEGLSGWNPSPQDTAASLSTASPTAAHSGQNGLQVKQDAAGPGSWIQSSKVSVTAGKNYTLKFWARCLETSGVGVWVNFFNAEGKNIPVAKPTDMALQVPQDSKDWTEYHLDMKIPDGASTMAFSVHAYSKHSCLANFDDFTVESVQ